MSSLQSESAVSAHAVALAILVHAFVTRRLVNQRRRTRRAEKEEARRANREQRRQTQLQQQQQAVQQTPDKRAQSLAASPAAAAAASPAPSGDGSFFASPTASSTGGGGGSEQGTPAPVSFNLGLGLGPNAAPFNLGLALGLAAGDGLPGQNAPVAAAPSPEEAELARQRKEESWARFPQRDYIQLGLFLHKAVQVRVACRTQCNAHPTVSLGF